jgi:two-component system chemotaxis response regulator CheY
VKSPTVIVVDDDPEVLSVLVEVVEAEGYPVRRATHGREALDAIHACEARECVVLLDMMMPVMSGAEVLQALRQEGVLETMPVIVITAMHPSYEETAGARMCLHKPVDIDRLLRTLAHVAAEVSRPPHASGAQLRADRDAGDEPEPATKR